MSKKRMAELLIRGCKGLEYPEEMRDIKESYAALPMSVPLHDLDKKYQPSSAGATCCNATSTAKSKMDGPIF